MYSGGTDTNTVVNTVVVIATNQTSEKGGRIWTGIADYKMANFTYYCKKFLVPNTYVCVLCRAKDFSSIKCSSTVF